MKREAGGPCLSAVFVDYDNIYLSLKRKSEEAAKRFAKDAGTWLRDIENGRLITATNSPFNDNARRIVMNRCYGNPVPRRNQHDNSTDMNSFPFVRHHFLRAGFEVVDCPPLTAQLKNSSDIRMVMDVRDYLTHDTYFDEFIILSGDADFTPVLHRLRAHARRTVIFANDYTAAPYTAISDGEIREADLITLILNGQLPSEHGGTLASTPAPSSARLEEDRRLIMGEIVASVRGSPSPVPLEALADRAVRALGHDRTIATAWAGAGSFRELLRQSLPEDVRLTGEPPYLAYDPRRHALEAPKPMALSAFDPAFDPVATAALAHQIGSLSPEPPQIAPSPAPRQASAAVQQRPADAGLGRAAPPAPPQPAAAAPVSNAIHQSIARIQEACQAPPLAPPEYRVLFEIMAKEISDNDQIGAQTLANITQRAQERGLELRRDDVRFVLEVVSEADPWFEQGASANLFAGRFRNFVVARCRGQGLNLSADELDLIDAWFAGGTMPQPPATRNGAPKANAPAPAIQGSAPQAPAQMQPAGARWWGLGGSGSRPQSVEQPPAPAAPRAQQGEGDELPRIVSGRRRS